MNKRKSRKNSRNSKKTITAIVIAAVMIAGGAIAGAFLMSNPYAHINYDKYIKLGEYKNLIAEKPKVKVTQKDLDAVIEQKLSEAEVTKEVKKGMVKKGDTIVINYIGKMDGKEVKEATASKQTIIVGNGNFIEGFEDGLIGEKIGKVTKLNLTFPKDYDKKFAGKDIEFTVEIISKQVSSKPEYNIAFIKKHSKFKTKEAYEENLRKEIRKEQKKLARDNAKNDLWSRVIASSTVEKYPERIIEKEKDLIDDMYEDMAKNYGITMDEFITTYLNTNKKGFDKQLKIYAETSSTQKMIAYAIVDKESGIDTSRSEYKKFKEETLEEMGMTKSEFKEQQGMSFDQYAKDNDLYNIFIIETVKDFIYDNANLKNGFTTHSPII